MVDGGREGLGGLEVAAVVIVAVFLAVVLFGLFSAIAGLVWSMVKLLMLVVVLWLLVRWALRRSRS